MTVEHGGIGILGHVFTRPEQRRKGIASHIMTAQMDDFRERNGRALTLGTGFDSPPFWIYHSYGFRSIAEGSGAMWYWKQPEQAKNLWHAALTGTAPPRWEHWPLVNLLCAQPEGDRLRHAARRVWGQRSFEGDFMKYKRELDAEDSSIAARLLENEAGSGGGLGECGRRSALGRGGSIARSLRASGSVARGLRSADSPALASQANIRLRR